jgi:hypothetical protein
LTPREQLVADRTTELMSRHAKCFTADVERAGRTECADLRWIDLVTGPEPPPGLLPEQATVLTHGGRPAHRSYISGFRSASPSVRTRIWTGTVRAHQGA